MAKYTKKHETKRLYESKRNSTDPILQNTGKRLAPTDQ